MSVTLSTEQWITLKKNWSIVQNLTSKTTNKLLSDSINAINTIIENDSHHKLIVDEIQTNISNKEFDDIMNEIDNDINTNEFKTNDTNNNLSHLSDNL